MRFQHTRFRPGLTAALIGGLALSGAAAGQQSGASSRPADQDREGSTYKSYATLTGTVADAGDDQVKLDYGDGLITVDLEAFDWDQDARPIAQGERVTVFGRIDQALYDEQALRATSLYAYNRSAYYYADQDDRTAFDLGEPVFINNLMDREGTWIALSGEVVGMDGRDVTLDTGESEITVDTSQMQYDPTDAVGYLRLRPGDRISAAGFVDTDLFEERELVARSLVSLQDRRKQGRRTDRTN